nr:DUF6166 domain-containing protein [Chloroflexus sp.]
MGGLSWGNAAAGASALAFALLAAEFGEAIAEMLYGQFRAEVVSSWNPEQPWRLHSFELRQWLASSITTRRLLAQMSGEPAPLLVARVYPWAEGSSVDASWADALTVLSTGEMAFDGEAIRMCERHGKLARLVAAGGVVWSEVVPIDRLRELVPPLVDGCELRLLRYPSLGHAAALPANYDGCCLVRWRRWHGSDGPVAAVVVSELTGELAAAVGLTNESTTITNRATWLATVLRAELDVAPERQIYVEHLPARGVRSPGGWDVTADFSRVTGDWKEGPLVLDAAPAGLAVQMSNPRWSYFSRDAAEQLTGISLDDTAMLAAWNSWPATIEGARR